MNKLSQKLKQIEDLYLKQGAGKDLKIVGTQKDGSGMVFAFKKDNKQLQEGVNKALKELKEDGTLTEISKKWYGQDAAPEDDKFEETIN